MADSKITKKLQVLPHNREAFFNARDRLRETNRTCVVEPTGCGKSYVALQFYQEFRGRRILYLTSYKAILDYFRILLYNELGMETDGDIYSNLKDMDYAGYDFIILDEFHRCGAEKWMQYVIRLLEANPNAKVLGLSATPIRYLDNERDMSEELFNGDIAYEMTLPQAIERGILPFPDYRIGLYSLRQDFMALYRRYSSRAHKSPDTMKTLEQAKRRLEDGIGMPDLFHDTIRNPSGKYIVFCSTIEKLQQYKQQSQQWFRRVNWDINKYEYHSKSTEDGLAKFTSDKSAALKLLYVCDSLNEGVHIEDVDGVIFLRLTESANIYFQQIGRALSVSGRKHPQIIDIVANMQHLNGSFQFASELEEIKSRNPDKYKNVIFDISSEEADLIAIMKDTLRRLHPRWEDMYASAKQYFEEHGDLNPSFDYCDDDIQLGAWLIHQRYLKKKGLLPEERIQKLDDIHMIWDVPMFNWMQKYQELELYVDEHGDMRNMPSGYSQNSVKLHAWIIEQRRNRKLGILSQDKIDMLDALDFCWDPDAEEWERRVPILTETAKVFGNINVPNSYVVDDDPVGQWVISYRVSHRRGSLPKEKEAFLESLGIIWEYDRYRLEESWNRHYEIARAYFNEHGDISFPYGTVIDGVKMYAWLVDVRQRKKKGKLTDEKIKALEALNIVWEPDRYKGWDYYYGLCKEYYEEHGALDIPKRTRYKGEHLGEWLATQRVRKNGSPKYSPMSDDERKALDAIGMVWSPKILRTWDEWLDLYKEWVRETGTVDVPVHTVYHDAGLGEWIRKNRKEFKKGTLTDEQVRKMNDAGMVWEALTSRTWDESFKDATRYYEKHGDLAVPSSYKTDSGFNLGGWIIAQRQKKRGKTCEITEEQIHALDSIGMIWDPKEEQWQTYYRAALSYRKENGDLLVPKGYVTEDGLKLGDWIVRQRGRTLDEEHNRLLTEAGMIWTTRRTWDDWYAMAEEYYSTHGDIHIPQAYKTSDGAALGSWVYDQRRKMKTPGTKRGSLSAEQIEKLKKLGC